MQRQTKMPFKSLSATLFGLALLITPVAVPVLAQEGAKPITSQKKVTLLASDSILLAKASKSKSASFSSGDGSASGSITWTGTKNFNYRFTLKSKSGKPVYIQAQGFRDFAPDAKGRRMTGNTTSKRGQSFAGSFSGGRGELKWTGVYLRVCTDKSFAPDTCGPRRAIRR